MSPRTGRPKSDNPKSEQIKIRATKQDKALLEACCEVTGKTQYEVVMEGINKVYENIIAFKGFSRNQKLKVRKEKCSYRKS